MDIGSFLSRTCGCASRRSFLRAGMSLPFVPLALGAAGMGGGGIPGSYAVAADARCNSIRAKSVIFIWLWGAPSHLDTFDPKPDAPADVRGPFAPISTRTPGLQLSELLPRLASRSHLFNVVRSNVTFAPGHPDAGTFGLTGFPEKPLPVKPNFGSIIAKYRGEKGSLPAFAMLGRGIPKDVVRIVDGYVPARWGRRSNRFSSVALNSARRKSRPSSCSMACRRTAFTIVEPYLAHWMPCDVRRKRIDCTTGAGCTNGLSSCSPGPPVGKHSTLRRSPPRHATPMAKHRLGRVA